MWYQFTAWNQEIHYGWTQDAAVAYAVLATLNRGKSDVNQYGMQALGDGEDVADSSGHLLQSRNDHLCDDDTTMDDVAAHCATADE